MKMDAKIVNWHVMGVGLHGKLDLARLSPKTWIQESRIRFIDYDIDYIIWSLFYKAMKERIKTKEYGSLFSSIGAIKHSMLFANL